MSISSHLSCPTSASHSAPIAMSDIRLGKYAGRVIARVHTATGLDLATVLLFERFAGIYQGRGARPR